MRRVIPLASLIKAADELIEGGNKQESVSTDPFVEKLAAALEGATESVGVEPGGNTSQADIEKIAEALNVIDAASGIEAAKSIDAFIGKARGEGYSDEQIDSALNKVAAAKLHQSMPLLVALGIGTGKRPNAKELGERLMAYSRQQATSNAKTQGY